MKRKHSGTDDENYCCADAHAQEAEQVVALVESNPERGLSEAVVDHHRTLYGANTMPSPPPATFIQSFSHQFRSALMIMILAAAAVSFAIHHVADGIFISIVVLLNALLGAVQEFKAQRALAVLRSALTFRATVLREGTLRSVRSEDVVCGDVVIARPGDRIVADGRVLVADAVCVSEAALSGESQCVPKQVEPVERETDVMDRSSMVYAGTTVEDGVVRYVVTATGMRTQMGRIAALIAKQESRPSPLQQLLTRIVHGMAVFVVVSVAAFVTVGIWMGHDVSIIALTAVALVVSTIPEGLLPAITVVLVIAMRRLMRRKALVRRLRAVETMGAISVICMDKTGTLTTGVMRVRRILTPEDISEATSDISNRGVTVEQSATNSRYRRIVEIGYLVNDATVDYTGVSEKEPTIHGRPTDAALLHAGLHAGCDATPYTLRAQVPFHSARKYAARLYDVASGKRILMAVGAPDRLLEYCTHYDIRGVVKPMTSAKRADVLAAITALMRDGYRVLVCALRPASQKETTAAPQRMVFVGVLVLHDPVRTDVRASVQSAQAAGVRSIVITGDHRDTAMAVLADAGIDVLPQEVMEGAELSELSEKQLATAVQSVRLFARVAPEHKIRIVRALMTHGHVVAMVGDGVNDAPALKAADVSIAPGSGTDLARSVADVVLLDDSFTTIVRAIRQGRLVFLNVKRLLFFLLVDDFTELVLFFAALFAGAPLPLLPAQILWINLIEDGLPGMALTASRHGADSMMRQRPQRITASLFTRGTILFAIAVFVISSIAAVGMFFYATAKGLSPEEVRTILFILMSMDSLVFAYSVQTLHTRLLSRAAVGNMYLNISVAISLGLLIAGVFVPSLQALLGTVLIPASMGVIIVLVVLLEIVMIECVKGWLRRLQRRTTERYVPVSHTVI